MKARHSQQGFSVIELVLIVGFLGIVAVIGLRVASNHTKIASLSSAPASSSTKASTVSTAPDVAKASDLTTAQQILNANDPTTANSADSNQLDNDLAGLN